MTNISRSKGNQAIKFGRLLEYSIWNNFLVKLYTKCAGKTIPRPLSKNQNWAYLWIKSVKFYTVCFNCMSGWGLSKCIESKLRSTCFYHIQIIFKKIKRGLELVSQFWFSAWFLRIFFSCYITWPNFIAWFSLLYQRLGNVSCNCLLTRLWRHKFWS